MADEKPDMVKVACSIPNGLELHLFVQGFDDGTGVKPMHRDYTQPRVFLSGPNSIGAGVGNTMLNGAEPVHTEVPAPFFETWLKQNENNPLVVKGLIAQVDKEREGREGK